ncbi:MAG: TIGR01777 family oxidoreductase [Prolixibacteraceae bacterium]|nr:TIGR01777 family oxidoreductase [Prolixibacteraceae bacterium]MBN2775895.1 TIGR01777 family oxidoreductase [Prolixibacteraceae bacterium]
MKIVITGSSGFIGQALIKELKKSNHLITEVKREWLSKPALELSEIIKNSDAVINLAGASIMSRWTKQNKRIIYESRVKTTLNLVEAIKILPAEDCPEKFISASAVGIYKNNNLHNESSLNYNDGFLGKVVKDWEDASECLPKDINRVIFRIGLVLGKDSKIIKKMKFPFKLGLGATIGDGRQAFPFIHIDDVVNAFILAIEINNFSGTYNLAAPERISNKDFTKTFAGLLNRPAFFRIPGFILRILLGEVAEVLLKSPAVVPKKLMDSGFIFRFPEIKTVLEDII